MIKATLVKTILFIVRSMFEHGEDLVGFLFSRNKIEDSEFYKRQPKKRQITLLKERRRAQRLVKAK